MRNLKYAITKDDDAVVHVGSARRILNIAVAEAEAADEW